MEIAVIGLGKMGLGISKRLMKNGHTVFGYDSSWDAKKYKSNQIEELKSLNEIPGKFRNNSRKIIWVMVPSGEPTKSTINELSSILDKNDIIIDGGNSFYKESVKTSSELSKKNIYLIDSGTSGGIWGEKEGYCLMIGGDKDAYEYCESIFESLSTDGKGYGYMGPSGSGHFVKMIHNGIEYGMMQSMAEGIEILHEKKEFNLNLAQITSLWQHIHAH